MKSKNKKISTKNKSKKPLDPNRINILSEKEVSYVDLEVDMGENVYKNLLEYGRNNILKDEKALINWAFITAIENGLKEIEKK